MKIDVRNFSNYLEPLPTKAVMDALVKYLETDAYEQIVYNFKDKDYIKAAIKYYEDLEDYEKCQQIVNFISVYNRLNGTEIQTK